MKPPLSFPLLHLLLPLLLLLFLTLSPLALSSAPTEESLCLTTFAELDASTPLFPYRSSTFSCPAHCDLLQPRPPVYGSYPYAGASSVCLSAVHCGVVSASQGGSVFLGRFYRADWSNSSSQSVFPNASALNSSSNGVASLPVPPAWNPTPAPASLWSYTVRGRGELLTQARRAPFPPRRGHVHVSSPLLQLPTSSANASLYRSYHLVLAGYDGRRYLNDVWAAAPSDPYAALDLEWTRLPDAPFSPRSDVSVAVIDATQGRERRPYNMVFFVGGQTAHACGQRELGVCSDEVWLLYQNVTWDPLAPPALFTLYLVSGYTWATLTPVARLPFPPRCGPVLWTQPNSLPGTMFLGGGQMSYPDPHCSVRTPTVPHATNEVWANFGLTSKDPAVWQQQDNAPFSPRRGQALEAALEVGILSPALVGGYAVAGVRYDKEAGAAVLTAVDVYADAWTCTELQWLTTSNVTCVWLATTPTTSVPVPTAAQGDWADRSYMPQAGARFGGWTARQALEDWAALVPPDTSGQEAPVAPGLFNVSVMLRGLPPTSPTAGDVAEQRLNLSLSYRLGEAELTDPSAPFLRGSPYVAAHSPWLTSLLTSPSLTQPSVSTLHPQATSLAVSPDDATPYLPQSASSASTARPTFRVDLPRLGAAYQGWSAEVLTVGSFGLRFVLAEGVVSGGCSGERCTSDWLTSSGQVRCLVPDDPSFAETLGPLRWWSDDAAVVAEQGSLPQGALLSVACLPGYHFRPAFAQGAAESVFCAPNGLWMDYSARTVRSCVRDSLKCSAPLVDLGGVDCQPPRPVIATLDAFGLTDVRGNVTLLNLPVTPRVPLRITGSFFSTPLTVTVGGQRCEVPTLLDPFRLCFNTSCDGARRLWCDPFAHSLTCTLPALLGLNLPVSVQAGRLGLTAETADGGRPTVSSTPPVLHYLGSPQCQESADFLHLTQCPSDAAYNVTACATTASMGNLTLEVILGAQERLPCSPFVFPLPRSVPLSSAAQCALCVVSPRLGRQQVRLQSIEVAIQSPQDASISSSACRAGYRTEIASAASNGSAAMGLCVSCPEGSSTLNVVGAFECQSCKAGHYANASGSADCYACTPGTYAEEWNSTQCAQCPLNSFQPQGAQSHCVACEAGQHVVYPPSAQDPITGLALRSDGQCIDCPAAARCLDGNVTAVEGAFLLIDGRTGEVSGVPCAQRACLDALQPECAGQAPQLVPASQLPVSNCCAQGRYPAYAPTWDEELGDTGGVNVLCALCRPGYTEMSGVCVECAAVQWGALCGVLLLSLLAIYLIHRLPHDHSGTATWAIVSYFLQQSALFLPFASQPQLLSLANLDLLSAGRGGAQTMGMPYSTWCLIPLSNGVSHIVLSLLSMLTLFGLLGVVAGLHWTAYQALRAAAARRGANHPSYRRACRVYSLVFMSPSPSPASWDALLQPLAPLAPPSNGDAAAHKAPVGGEASLSAVAPVSVEQAIGEQVPASAVLAAAGREAAKPRWVLYQRSAVRLLQSSYTAVTLLCIRFFHTRRIGGFGQRLVDYPAVDTDSSGYRALQPGIVALIALVVCLLPTVMFAYLARQQRKGQLAGLTRVAPVGGGGARVSLLRQLCCMFDVGCRWWMPPFLHIRRVLVVTVFVMTGAQRWVWLTLLNYLLLALHLQLQPYARRRDNALEGLALLSLALQTSLLCAWSPEGRVVLNAGQMSIFVALIAAPLTTSIVAVCARTRRKRLQRRQQEEEEANAL